MPGCDPRQEYQDRRLARQALTRAAAGREALVGRGRVAVFVLGLVVAYLAFIARWLHPLWLLPVAGVFVVLLFAYEAVFRAWHRASRAVAFYDAGLARLADDWKGKGQPGTRFQDETHPYAADIDLFGPGSLFELLCTARTRRGEDTLAGWLKAGAPPPEVRARQEAVADLRGRLELREDLAILGGDLPVGVDFDGVVAWGAEPPVLRAQWPGWVALLLGVVALCTFVGWVGGLLELFDPETDFGEFVKRAGPGPFALAVLVEAAFAGWYARRVNRVLASVERRGRDLALLASVLACLEKASFAAPRLVELHRDLTQGDGTGWLPSERIAQLGGLIDQLNSRRNLYFAPFAYMLLWGTQFAFAIERWRQRSGPAIGRWLEVVGEFEALCALATYAYENPDDPFPEVVEPGPCFEGEGLGHPLLPRGKCVPNDLRLGTEPSVLVVSGSNMSGKSTFLRTVGINAVLALAGAPVRARRVRISPLVIGATLRIQDSLQAGRSRFYAELLRVRQVVELSRGPVPLLFLLDEIFAGTNSHDRRVGAEAVVRGLEAAGAIGLVTTHDLTLTQIADALGAKSANVHFADHFEAGVMRFDYRLHEGVVQKSNALELMRAVGLRV